MCGESWPTRAVRPCRRYMESHVRGHSRTNRNAERPRALQPLGVDRWRPPQATPIPNLFVAGDWTATGWPATMEGAVRSGYLAAEALLKNLGEDVKCVQPDLGKKE